ncbi:RNA methyltransferase, RsmE family [Chitinivibrio alkaliphilus ACht1]|uniref:Ribosomal RNA small subunit methyltransferase E n=2 Tax=Chitinivibrio TaxID=1505231 RepID=U7DCP7_9BACT|nr:RNA methyltransferase, RsmE family [Chitinivibrio alkaliphilus ACht1]
MRHVLRVSVGDTLRVGVLHGKRHTGVVAVCSDQEIILTVMEQEKPLPRKLPITLCVALPRPQTYKKVVYDATVLGVSELVFFHSRKVEKSYWHSPVLGEEKTGKLLRDALSQAGDTVPPRISTYPRFRPFAEDVLPRLLKGKEGFLFHPRDTVHTLSPSQIPVLYMVGPEGGFTDFEYELLGNADLLGVSLGERILRVEQAVATILGYSLIKFA